MRCIGFLFFKFVSNFCNLFVMEGVFYLKSKKKIVGSRQKGINNMKRFVGKIRSLLQEGSETFSDCKITMVAILLWTIVGVVCEVMENSSALGIDMLFMFFLLFAFSVFPIETRLKGRSWKKGIGCLLVGVISGGFTYLTYQGDSIESKAFIIQYMKSRIDEFLLGYLMLLLIFIFYFNFQKSEVSFPEYIGRVFSNLLPVGFIYIVLTIGFLFVWSAIESLLIEESNYGVDEEFIIMILVLGLYFFPSCMRAVRDVKKEISSVIQFVIKYIMTGFSICVIVIGYLYVLKILIQWRVPSNEVFSLLTTLFILSAPVWIMNEAYKEETLYSKILSWLPYFFAPLIGLQIYSIVVRIGAYGLTPSRYAGILLILFELVMVLVWRFARKSCGKLLMLIAGFVLIAVFVPFINMFHLSAMNQEYILKQYIQKLETGEEPNEEEYERLEGAYKYLRYQPEISDFDEKYGYLKELIEEGEESYRKRWHYIHGCQMVGELNVKGYLKMNMLNQSKEYDSLGSDEDYDVDFSKFKFYIRETGEEVFVDLSSMYEKALEYEEKNPNASEEAYSEYLKQFNKIQVDANTVFYVNHFEIHFYTQIMGEKEVTEITDVTISGMLLEN